MLILRIAAMLAVLVAGLATDAEAFDRTTKWYAVMVQPATDATPPLFLSNTTDGVALEPYRSGDATQMWTTVGRDYPTPPPVTSDSGIDIGAITSFFGCAAHGFSGCSWSGGAGIVAKVINRASGGCLMIARTAVAVTTTCAINDPQESWQLWRIAGTSGDPFSQFGETSGHGNCLTSDSGGRTPNFHQVRGVACGGKRPVWTQKFTMQLAADLACQVKYAGHVCFVDGQKE